MSQRVSEQSAAAVAVSDLMVGQTLHSSSTEYTILDFIGEGAFGKVAKCLAKNINKIVAVKILKKGCEGDVENELFMLQVIGQLNEDQINVVKFYERFQHFGLTCLVFEMLDIDLFHFLVQRCHGCSMYVDQIRPIAKQLLEALDALEYLEIIHSDIKPDNFMLANTVSNPSRVKLIDFGLAFHASSAQPGSLLQPIGYRAPEVSLGLPFSMGIDMWGLACSMAFLYLGNNLFPVHCEYLMMKHMVDILGMPPDHLLQHGTYTWRFFCQEEDTSGTRWRLLTAQEYTAVTHKQVGEWPDWRTYPPLDGLVYFYKPGEDVEMEDREAFIDFLKMLLCWDPKKRVCPAEALLHPFITMSHLIHYPEGRDYLTTAMYYMDVTPLEDKTSASPSTIHPVENVVKDPVQEALEQWDEHVDLPPSPVRESNTENNCDGEECWDEITDDLWKQRFTTIFDIHPDTEINVNVETGNQGHPDPAHHSRDEEVEEVLPSDGIVMEEISTKASKPPKFFRGFLKPCRKFFSRLRRRFSGCMGSSLDAEEL